MVTKTVLTVASLLIVLSYTSISCTEDPRQQARKVLDSALDVHGGPDAWEEVDTLTITAKGEIDQSGEMQGLHPEKPCLRSYEEKLFYDASAQAVARAVHAPRNDFSLRWRQTILRGEERMFIDFVSRSARRSLDPEAPAERQSFLRRIPHFVLREAHERADSLRRLGESVVNGRTQEVIAYTLETGYELAIFVDAEDHTVTKYELNLDFPTLGDTVLEWLFPEHKPIEPLGLFPAGHTVKVGGRTYLEVIYEAVEINEPLPSEAFAPPPDIALPPPPEARRESAPQSPQVTSIAEGVFFVTNLAGFNTMFMEFAEFILAVEAPANYPLLETIPPANMAPSSSLGEQYVEIIKATVPEKPIRYLALTHHHSDHVGGAPAFMAEGATILTTPGNQDFIHRMAGAVDVQMETFEGKKIVSDGERTVELIDMGPNPHTEEMVVLWIPAEGILFQGDLFYPAPLDYFPPAGRTIIMRHFAEWMRENQISPERIYGVHGRWHGTEEHVNKILSGSE